jgi:hypothetical protein
MNNIVPLILSTINKYFRKHFLLIKITKFSSTGYIPSGVLSSRPPPGTENLDKTLIHPLSDDCYSLSSVCTDNPFVLYFKKNIKRNQVVYMQCNNKKKITLKNEYHNNKHNEQKKESFCMTSIQISNLRIGRS